MSVIFFLIGIGIIVAGGFLIAFIWAVRSGQYDDDYTPSVRMLFDNYKADNPEVKVKDPEITRSQKKQRNKRRKTSINKN